MGLWCGVAWVSRWLGWARRVGLGCAGWSGGRFEWAGSGVGWRGWSGIRSGRVGSACGVVCVAWLSGSGGSAHFGVDFRRGRTRLSTVAGLRRQAVLESSPPLTRPWRVESGASGVQDVAGAPVAESLLCGRPSRRVWW